MITVENLISEYPRISQDSLPTALKQSEFEFIQENIDLYDEDETIKQYIDTFVEKLNESHSKNSDKSKHETKPTNAKTVKEKKASTAKLKEKHDKTKNHKTQDKKEELHYENVPKIDVDVSFIKRYVGLHGKRKDKQQILSLINSLQKAIVEKRIHKHSVYCYEIENIQTELIKCYNEMGNAITISIATDTLEKYTAIAKSEKIQPTISYIKQYISLHGKTGVKEKAKSLFDRINKAIDKGDISFYDIRYKELHEMQNSLVDYLHDKTTHITISESTLNGLMGLAGISVNGLNGLGNSLETVSPKLVSSETLSGMQFDTIGLQGKYRNLIGDPSQGFTAMVYGLPKSGKSTLSIDFAKYLAEHHGKVLYVAIEEGFGYTLQEKFERLNANHPNLEIAECLPSDLSKWDFVFIDSVSKAGYTNEFLAKLHKQFPKTAFIYIFHSTKDGKFRGGQEFAHEVDCIIDVEKGVASANGRFGVGGKLNVFEE
jgi:hypothetical protein